MTTNTKYYLKRIAGVLIILIGGGLVYFLFSPEESVFFPKCPFHLITGLDCPGCGSQRAIHHLLHLQIKEAFLSNPLLIVAIPYLILGLYIEYFGGKEKYPRMKQLFYSRNAVYIVLIIIIAFWIGRNLI